MAAMNGVEALQGRRVYIDANVFMYFLDGSTQWAAPAATVLRGAAQGSFAAVTGEAAVAEVMVGPYRLGDSLLIRSTREFFAQPRFVDVVGHSQEVWDDAAIIASRVYNVVDQSNGRQANGQKYQAFLLLCAEVAAHVVDHGVGLRRWVGSGS